MEMKDTIHYRRFVAHERPFLLVMIAWAKFPDGVFFAQSIVDRQFVHDAIDRFGRVAIRTYWRNVRAELGIKVLARENRRFDPAQRIDFVQTSRTYEETMALLGHPVEKEKSDV